MKQYPRMAETGPTAAQANHPPTAPLAEPSAHADTFWRDCVLGLQALRHGDRWIAALLAQAIVQSTLLPMAARAQDLPTPLTAAEAANQAVLAPLLARWQADLPLPTYWQVYAALISDYQDFRDREVSDSPVSTAAEAQALALLEMARRQPYPDFPDVISWRSISIILPAYNEEAVIQETVASCLQAVQRSCPNAEVIIVDDGSHDHTGAIGDDLAEHDARVVVVHNRPNKGYGGALLAGFAAARGELTFFMDSDGQFDINDIVKMLRLYEQHPGAAILGYRAPRRDPFMRQLNALGWKFVARAVLGVSGIKDIDCAFKLFPTEVMRACQLRAQGASVNAEFLAKFQRLGLPIYQLPVQHLPRTKGSPTGAKPAVIFRAFQEILALPGPLREWTEEVARAGLPPS